ncbi:MAG: hypothetical protein JW747_00485 [Candidatus Aminicenantes bacterium]|nr:hypothetical protein [Candidatus Aminicenantes bacterium]
MKESAFFRQGALGFALLAAVGVGSLQASPAPDWSLYLGPAVSTSGINGSDFDGWTYVTNEAVFISVPSIDSSVGFGLAVGGRWGWYGFEFSFLRSQHSGSFYNPQESVQGPVSAEFGRNKIGIDGLVFLPLFKGIEVYGIVGLGTDVLQVKNNFFQGEAYLVGNYDLRYRYYQQGRAYLNGVGWNFGLGLNIPISRSLFATMRVVYHIVEIDKAGADFTLRGFGEQVDQTYEFDALKGSEFSIVVGVNYAFSFF